MANKYAKGAISDGELLRNLITTFTEDKTPTNIGNLFRHLRKATVIVPVKVGDTVEEDEVDSEGRKKVKIIPSKITDNEGNAYLPVFSSDDQVKKEFVGNLTLGEITFAQCMAWAERINDMKGIVVDPTSTNFVVKKEFFYLIRQIEEKKM